MLEATPRATTTTVSSGTLPSSPYVLMGGVDESHVVIICCSSILQDKVTAMTVLFCHTLPVLMAGYVLKGSLLGSLLV